MPQHIKIIRMGKKFWKKVLSIAQPAYKLIEKPVIHQLVPKSTRKAFDAAVAPLKPIGRAIKKHI